METGIAANGRVDRNVRRLEMEWQPIETEPKQKQDCIVLTKEGSVFRAIAHKGWQGGFCIGDGKTGIAVSGVTYWMPFIKPSNF